MRTRRRPRPSRSRGTRNAAGEWGKRRLNSCKRTAAPRGAWSRSSRPRWDLGLAARERPVDFLDVGLRERAGGGLQAQRVDEEGVARGLQVAARLEHLLLGIQ